MITKSDPSKMKDLVSCLNQLQKDGYTEDFKVSELGLMALHKETVYQPDEIHVTNFYRFEGPSDPADNSILYAIETNDGIKGTLTDAYGPYADDQVEKFMEKVNELQKKVNSQS